MANIDYYEDEVVDILASQDRVLIGDQWVVRPQRGMIINTDERVPMRVECDAGGEFILVPVELSESAAIYYGNSEG